MGFVTSIRDFFYFIKSFTYGNGELGKKKGKEKKNVQMSVVNIIHPL